MSSAFSYFDSHEWRDFFHGGMEREEAVKLVSAYPVGSFLLRESKSKQSGYSLTVKVADSTDNSIRHYFIEQTESPDFPGELRFCFNGVTYLDLPHLIEHFRRNELEKTCLLRPVPRACMERVIGRYRFEGERVSDLPFERGEMLEVVEKPEPGWWVARNALKMCGLIPSTHVKVYEEGDEVSLMNPSSHSSSTANSGDPANRHSNTSVGSEGSSKRASSQELDQQGRSSRPTIAPAWVRVVADRNPSIFDTEAFVLRQGQMLYLTEVLPSGMCRGENAQREKGIFPLTYVEYTDLPPSAGPWSV